MSAATSTLRSTQMSHSPQAKNSPLQSDHEAKIKIEPENTRHADSTTPSSCTMENTSNGGNKMNPTTRENGYNAPQCDGTPSSVISSSIPPFSSYAPNGYGNYTNGMTPQYQMAASTNNTNGGAATQNTVDPTAPLPNEIFELLNEFWRPNDMNMTADQPLMNGKAPPRRSPEGSLDEPIDEEKEGDEDLTSLGDPDMNIDRNTQKRRYSRLSDGYERLKSVLPSVKDKRRVSKARILDEAINYIQRLESITSVLKREHEKRLNVINGSNSFFPDYSMQPYMRSLFQKQMYPQSLPATKMNQYPKMSTAPASILPKSPRIKNYNQYPTTQNPLASANMATDYNYNNISNYSNSANGMYPSSGDPNQMINGDSSPITNNSPYSACSLSPGSTPTTYQDGSTGSVNNTWPYQGGSINGYADSVNQLSNYGPSRPASNPTGYGTASAGGYSNINGSSNMWGTIGGINENSSAVSHTDHSMKVG